MESELLADKEKSTPPVPLKTYQWEDLRRAREAGGYPWTHLLKVPLDSEITAEDILRETTPKRSMSREISRSRTRSPDDKDIQKILNLDSSPGSSRKHGEEGEDEGVHIPNFSKEVSLDLEDDAITQSVNSYLSQKQEFEVSDHLVAPVVLPKNVSPKSILKRRVPEQQYTIGITETREKTKCCHPLVNKIKHLADKTLHKLERSENEKSPLSKRKKNEDTQEIRQLKSSPGAVRRQKFSAIKLGDSDEMSKTIDIPPLRKNKDHIYEDIEESRMSGLQKPVLFSHEHEENHQHENTSSSNKENESILEKKSITSQDPSLVTEEISLKSRDYVMEQLHSKIDNVDKEAVLLDDEMDADEPNVDEIFQNQLDERPPSDDSPNITITEITDDDGDIHGEQSTAIPIESSPSPLPRENEQPGIKFLTREWSRPSSDHEYEIIEKPSPNIVYTAPSVDEKPTIIKTDDELSSTTSLERKLLQHTSDDDEQLDYKLHASEDKSESIMSAEILQKDIEDRFFANTPSTVSRTECEISTSQVDSSALEQLPLKRDSRKNTENVEKKLQQKIKESTGKLKTQAGKLKTKLQNIKMKQQNKPEIPKTNTSERPKFKLPERPKISFPERPKFTLPDRRKFSLPDRPKFKKINISEKLSFVDRKKFTLPDRPKFNVPDLPKFKMPDIHFPSLGKKKEYKVERDTESATDLRNVATVEFEAKTYPRFFNRKKKSELSKTSSSPTLGREETPPPTFTFTRVKKTNGNSMNYIPDSPVQPREYGSIENGTNYDIEEEDRQGFDATYDFDKLDSEYINEESELTNINKNLNASSTPDISPSKQEYAHVINEIDNDEFFVRPRGISRENIQVREYLSDEIRQAFKIPQNVLSLMGSNSGVDDEHRYINEPEADPELTMEENEQMRYSSEDINEKDDGYYTFPPVRPSRAKRKKKDSEPIEYIDNSINASIQFSEIDLGLPDDHDQNRDDVIICEKYETNEIENDMEFTPTTDLRSIHEYANDDVIQYPESLPVLSQTLPMPPKRKKKGSKKESRHSSLSDFKKMPSAEKLWEEPQEKILDQDIIVYRTEHEYIVPQADVTMTEQSPVPPRRNRSRSSRGTSLCDDDRTSHGAESLTLDTNIVTTEGVDADRERYESPGYATVDKGQYMPSKGPRRSKSKTPPVRRRKSNSSERKYYTVGSPKTSKPNRPPRKKSSSSLMTLNSFTKQSISGDITQYVEIDEPFEIHKNLKSGEVLNKMKDRPLPPPPRPPRGSKRRKKEKHVDSRYQNQTDELLDTDTIQQESTDTNEIVEIEVSTQTDPLPDDLDYELGIEENLDLSMSSSLRDIIDEDSILSKSQTKLGESPRVSRPTSQLEKSKNVSDPKIPELCKSNLGRSSPTVILVERRVSSPTRINEREEMLTEASLTVQHIDIEESQIPTVPPLPRSRGSSNNIQNKTNSSSENQALERISDTNRDIQLDNLITQRLQVRDLDVGRLNVSELQASKILVSDIEGMTLQVAELDSKSGHISVSGVEFSPAVIDEIVKKFAEISTTHASTLQTQSNIEHAKPISKEEETQTEILNATSIDAELCYRENISELPPPPQPLPLSSDTKEDTEISNSLPITKPNELDSTLPPNLNPITSDNLDDTTPPPQRPPPPDLTPLLYSYLQDIALPSSQYYSQRPLQEHQFTEFHETQNQSPPPPSRRVKRKPVAPQSESSSDERRLHPSPRRIPPPVKAHEPSISEAGAQFLRVCHNSITRIIKNMFNSFLTYISGTEDKKDVQMALVIFLVLIAGLIMFGLSDSRTIHHHHWEFFNPPDTQQ